MLVGFYCTHDGVGGGWGSTVPMMKGRGVGGGVRGGKYCSSSPISFAAAISGKIGN